MRMVNVTKSVALMGSALLLLSSIPGVVTAGTIVGSRHDFSGSGWSGGEICIACHTPHNADVSVALAPLWNHEITSLTYTPYPSGGTMDSNPGQPDGISKLCLSCHDGSVALDSFGGASGSNFMIGDPAVGGDAESLTNDHPLSMTYDTALSVADPGLYDPDSRNVTVGVAPFTDNGTITDVLLSGQKVQCSSCHDVHNNEVQAAPLLRISQAGSGLCLTCHNK